MRMADIPLANKAGIGDVLKRRLFVSHETDQFKPVHRTITEFLAATDLSKRVLNNSLPVERVLTLICGNDGKPVSPLRGLFAWLMCMFGPIAECYVARDPYGIVAYGDANVLPPSVQHAIWDSLQKLSDPWFLEKQEDRNLLGCLANSNTFDYIQKLLADSTIGVHLKIAIFDAIANSSENIGLALEETLWQEVLGNHDNVWLRSSALRAYARTVNYDWGKLKRLDQDLVQSTNDPNAPVVRAELLCRTKEFGEMGSRILSIMEHAASQLKKPSAYGYYHRLQNIPTGLDLDDVLDGAPEIFKQREIYFEIKVLYQKWFKSRLGDPSPISPRRLANWLHVGIDSEQTQMLLKKRFLKDPFLFERVFHHIADIIPIERFRSLLVVDLPKLLPDAVWPVPRCEFLLACAEKAENLDKAAEFFRAYLSCFPHENASISLAEAGFELLDRRSDIVNSLGDWRYSKIDNWMREHWAWEKEQAGKEAEIRNKNIAYLSKRLNAIRAGTEKGLLEWAAPFYLGFFRNSSEVTDPLERLVNETNDEIANAFLEGFIRYLEGDSIPSLEEIINSINEGKIFPNALLGLSIFLRLDRGIPLPEKMLPQSIAAAITTDAAETTGFNEKLSDWVFHVISHKPKVVKSVLTDMWIACVRGNGGNLWWFNTLDAHPETQQFLAQLSVKVLRVGINEDSNSVKKLVSVLLRLDEQVALTIGKKELLRAELSAEVRAIWITVLYLIEPDKYLNCWRALSLGSDSLIWEAIELIGAVNEENGISLTSAQHAEIILLVGRRFPNENFPIGGFWGSRNSWDASHFVRKQIAFLSASNSADAADQFGNLENDTGLASYWDWIRHHRVQYQNKLRDMNFNFATPDQAASVLQNKAPASPGDLLALIVDHIEALSRELARTQKEKYRVYWNHNGKYISEPKYETICSKILADDIQNRVGTSQHLIVTVEHHMVADKKCDIAVLHEDKILPIEVKHHYNRGLWEAWQTQLDRLYTKEIGTGGVGIYLVLWSGETEKRRLPTLPRETSRPANASELKEALESLIPEKDKHRLKIVVLDISGK